MKSVEHVLNALKASHVKRFHTKFTLTTQTIGEHSAAVALLCYAVAPKPVSANLLLSALLHDHAEAWTGDIPAPVKKRSATLNEVLWHLEREAHEKHLGLPPGMVPLTEEEELILHLCDNFEGALYTLHEVKLGNYHLRATAARYAEYLSELLAEHTAPSPLATELLQHIYQEIKTHGCK